MRVQGIEPQRRSPGETVQAGGKGQVGSLEDVESPLVASPRPISPTREESKKALPTETERYPLKLIHYHNGGRIRLSVFVEGLTRGVNNVLGGL